MPLPSVLLLIDDAVAVLIVTILGLRMHQLDADIWERLPFTFIPFYLLWVLCAAVLQLYDPAQAGKWQQLWRVFEAAAIAALPAAALRAFWLGTPLVPVFVLVMGAALAAGLLVSRSIYIVTFGSRWRPNG